MRSSVSERENSSDEIEENAVHILPPSIKILVGIDHIQVSSLKCRHPFFSIFYVLDPSFLHDRFEGLSN